MQLAFCNHSYLGNCASKRASSASVESVYSGATKLSDDAKDLADNVLAAYIFCHYNCQFGFLSSHAEHAQMRARNLRARRPKSQTNCRAPGSGACSM